jgi:iron complex transport system ATP-binding protein
VNAAVVARNLSVGYRRPTRVVIEGATVSADAGSFVAVLGANGAGKSTLLRTVAGLQAPLAGALELCSRPIAQLKVEERARLVAVVLTDRAPLPALTVRQIVEWGRYPHVGWAGRLSANDHNLVEDAMDAAGATALADRMCDSLSDGEFQRVHLARALAQQPDVLVLDEPTAFLDAPSRLMLMATLRRIAAAGRTVIVATHELEAALDSADHVWLVTRDRRVRSGGPAAMRASGEIARAFGMPLPEITPGGFVREDTCAASAR